MIGKYPAKLDEKGRLFVPSKLRGELGSSFVVTLGVNCGHRCLTIYKETSAQHFDVTLINSGNPPQMIDDIANNRYPVKVIEE